MEETNFHRAAESCEKARSRDGPADSETSKSDSDLTQNSPYHGQASTARSLAKQKTYLQKLKVLDEGATSHPNRLVGMASRPLIFLSFPVILYAGFCYGSNLIWFNVLNGTTSLILSKQPFGFSSSMVGLSYISPLIGSTIG